MKSNWLFALLSLLIVAARGFQLEEAAYRSGAPKNIIFGALVPGSSHVTWVLRFLDELAERGHNVTFVTVVSYSSPQKREKKKVNGVRKSDRIVIFLYLLG